MTVIQCDICGKVLNDKESANAYRLHFWHENNIYKIEDICADCVPKVKETLEGLKGEEH